MAETKVTSTELAPASTADANGWNIINLGTFSIATKRYSVSVGVLNADTATSLTLINAPAAGTVISRQIRGSHTASGAEILYSIGANNNETYIRNVSNGATIGAGTVVVELLYIVTNP